MQLIPLINAVQRATPDALLHAFRAASLAAAPLVATALWQGLAIAGGLAICLRLAPRMPAAQRFTVWAAGFAVLVALPFAPRLTQFTSTALPATALGLAEASTRPWLQLDVRWSMAIAAIWLAASAFLAADLAVHSFRLRKLWKDATPVDTNGSCRVLARPAFMRVRRTVQVCSSQMLDRPSVIGFFAPRILIPEWLLPRLTPDELQQVILHEAEHLRRGDDWINLFQKLCLVLFPLNPALWWIERRLCQEREMACDDGVIRVTRAPRAYAACLANLAERGLQHRAQALSLGAWHRRSELVRRVHRILRHSHTLSTRATPAVLATLCCGLLLGSVELARCPQLVGFVAAQNSGIARASAMHPSLPAPARLINTAYVPVHESTAATRRFSSPKPNALVASASSMRVPSRPFATAEAKIPSAQLASTAAQHTPNAELTASSGSVAEQQWFVVTTWQQVQTTSPIARQAADYDTGESATQSNANLSAPVSGRVTSQLTVTQLIFKVLPASSRASQPVAVPVRDGWFVIQL